MRACPRPAVENVIDRLGGIVLRGELRSLFPKKGLERDNQRLRLFLMHGSPLIGWFAIDVA
jgi:hypothetical protein